MERLDKFLADGGLGSRAQVKTLLKAGRVTVDGQTERDGGRKLEPQSAEVCVDGVAVGARGRIVLLMNKPSGYLTATQDDHARTVMELLPQRFRKIGLNPVGRLDKETEGLLLLTNDGELLHRLISPKRAIAKVYYARHAGTATAEDIAAFAQGVTLRDGTVCLPAVLECLGPGESLITVCEGKYHQVRRMMAARGMPVAYLQRRQEAELTLEGVSPGQIRQLRAEEVEQLLRLTGV